jgi:Na+/melibiose symporter-like transporter
MTTLGRYSFLIGGVVLWAIISFALWRWQSGPVNLRVIASVIVAIGFVGLWVALRPTENPDVTTVEAADALIGHGKPVMLEFFSEY